jgi:hypothetical protein
MFVLHINTPLVNLAAMKPEDTWAVGNRVRDLYVKKSGQQPEKDLRPKTNDRGSHCFALYDEAEWRSTIEQVIRERDMQKCAQGSLF